MSKEKLKKAREFEQEQLKKNFSGRTSLLSCDWWFRMDQ